MSRDISRQLRLALWWLFIASETVAALRLFNQTDDQGFDCAVVVRGTAPLSPGSAFADQGPAIRNALVFFAEWVNTTHGGVKINVDGEPRTCFIDLVVDDDRSDLEEMKAYYEAYMAEADMVTGPYSTTLASPAADIRLISSCLTIKCLVET